MEGAPSVRVRNLAVAISAGLLAVVVLVVMAGTAFAQGSTGDPTRGKYIYEAATGCGCHGPNLAGYKAGNPPLLPAAAPFGQRFDGPFGSVTAKNLTPDKATGLGNWTDDQIVNAIRNGVDDQGKPLFPIMPFASFHFMSDQDVHDLVAYLRTVPPVNNPVPENQLNVPVPAPPQLPPSPATAPASGVDRGKYLVSAVSLCNDCHTPSTASGAPDTTKLLAGSYVPEGPTPPLAPNITPDKTTGIGNWTEQQIVTLLKTGTKPNGSHVGSLMAAVVGPPGYANLTDADAAAIAAYLKSIPAVNNVPQPPAAAPAAAPAQAATPAAGATAAPAAAAGPGKLPVTGAEIPAGVAALSMLGAALASLGLGLKKRRR